ncbi:MAG: DUF1987 family protein [Bacteroidales bacterium]|nr:DUF1987 family protein [Bacteroidales bacterium]
MFLKTTLEDIENWKEQKDVERLIDALKIKNDDIINATINALDYLVKGDYERKITSKVIVALGDFKDIRSITLLIKFLDTDDDNKRKIAIESLCKLGVSNIIEPLIMSFDEKNGIRWFSNTVFSEFSKIIGIESFIACLKNDITNIRQKTATILGRIKNNKVVEPLINVLNDIEPSVIVASAEALGNLGDTYAVEPLIKVLNHENSNVRIECIKALDKLKDKRAIVPSINALNDVEYSVVIASANALGNYGDIGAVDPLIKTLNHEKSEVRVECIQVLAKLNDKRAIIPSINALNDPKFSVIIASAEALGNYGDIGAIDPLIKTLNHEKSEVRVECIKALNKLNDKRAIVPLINMLNDTSNHVIIASIETLGKFKNIQAVEPIIKALNTCDWEVKEIAAKVLGKLGDSRAIQPLLNLFGINDICNHKDVKVKEEIVNALNKLGYTKTIKSLKDELEKLFYIQGTTQTPTVFFDMEQGIFEYKGNVLPENSKEFHLPVFEILDKFIDKYPNTSLKATFVLEYYNTPSSKQIFQIFKKIEKRYYYGYPVIIYWYYEVDNVDIYEAGEDLANNVKIPFTMIAYKDYYVAIKDSSKEEKIFIEESLKSPMISFDKEKGIFEIKGNSLQEKTIEMYQPLIKPIESFVWNNKEKHYTINFQIRSCNRGSIDFFRRFLSFFNDCLDVTAKWYYNQGNEEMHSLGQTLKSELKYDLEIIQINDK